VGYLVGRHCGSRAFCQTGEIVQGVVNGVLYPLVAGDWDQARQAEHAAAVTLIRP
jgi:hypothetical protein